MFEVKKAVREKLKAAIAFIAPSGAGKTLSALFTAYGLMKAKYPDLSEDEIWDKIGFIDTEHRRSLIYASMEKAGVNIGSFLHVDFKPPFEVERYVAAFDALKKAGAEVVVADSLSHAWEGDGGLLELQQDMGGRFQDWIKTNPYYQRFVSLVTGEMHDLHVLNCVRTKQDYQVGTTDAGKLEVQKLGLKPVQRDSLEYEFQVVFNIGMNHVATTSKDNSGLFEETPQIITPKVGEKLFAWLEEGKDVQAEMRAEKQKIIADINSYKESGNAPLASYIAEMEKATEAKYPGGFNDLPIERVKSLLQIVKAKKIELEKESQGEIVTDPKSGKTANIATGENGYKKTVLAKIARYAEKESVELAAFIQDLEDEIEKHNGKKLKDLDDNALAKVMNKIEAKRVEIKSQIAIAKADEQAKLDKTRYWHHPESDAVFTTLESDGQPQDPYVEEISEERYNQLLAEDEKPQKKELKDYTVPQLKEFAKKYGIEGYLSMKKPQLVEALEELKRARAKA